MRGATDEEIDQAVADGVIDLFVAERMLVPSRRRYTRVEVAELTGVDLPKLERFWRALGFAGVDDDDRTFTDLDLEAVRLYQGLQSLGRGGHRHGAADGPGHGLVAGPYRRGPAGPGLHHQRRNGGRPGHVGRRLRRRGRRHHPGHDEDPRVRLAAPGGGGHPAHDGGPQPRPHLGPEPRPRRRVSPTWSASRCSAST